MTIFIKLIGLLAGLVILAGCATQGYVEVGTPIYYEPIYVGPPVYYWGPGPSYHYYHHHPRYTAPPPPHRGPVPAPRVGPTQPLPRPHTSTVPPRQQGPPQRPQRP